MVECRIEPVAYLLAHGLMELARNHWSETRFQLEHPDDAYDPDWDAYQRMEACNLLRFVAMREDGNLIGYVSVVVDTDIHNRKLVTATIRDIYVSQDKRGHAPKLIRYTESLLPEMGVKRILVGEQVNGVTMPGRFYRAMKYTHRENVYGKTIH